MNTIYYGCQPLNSIYNQYVNNTTIKKIDNVKKFIKGMTLSTQKNNNMMYLLTTNEDIIISLGKIQGKYKNIYIIGKYIYAHTKQELIQYYKKIAYEKNKQITKDMIELEKIIKTSANNDYTYENIIQRINGYKNKINTLKKQYKTIINNIKIL